MVGLKEERDRYADQNSELLGIRTNLTEVLDRYTGFQEGLKEHASQLKREIALRLSEAEGLKKENEALFKEIDDLRSENEVRKVEVYSLFIYG
jgi:cell division protein FtsB